MSSGYCPVCDKDVDNWLPLHREVDIGVRVEEPGGRLCPHCGSFERTRHIWIYMKQTRLLEMNPRFLHFGPERGLIPRLRAALGDSYVTTDIAMPNVDRKEDITHLTFDDSSFDFIYCSNVLEHVPDDRAAMRELYRVMAPGSTAIIQVPLGQRNNPTHEDPSIVEPAERYKHFGQADHVRMYGYDIKERLEAAGFHVEPCIMPNMLNLPETTIVHMNLGKKELIHKCIKGKA